MAVRGGGRCLTPSFSPCSGVSTFWMANPNNNLINCAAAGSEVSGTLSSLEENGELGAPGPTLKSVGSEPQLGVRTGLQ